MDKIRDYGSLAIGSSPIKQKACKASGVISSIASMVERMTVNHLVIGSNPIWGVLEYCSRLRNYKIFTLK